MNQQDPIRTGNWNIFRLLSASQVDYPDSEDHLIQTLRAFDYRDTLITLGRINLLLQCKESSEKEKILRRDFCSHILRNQIAMRNLTGYFIFGRESTLRLLDKSASLSDSRSGPAPDATTETRHDLVRCYLIINEFLEKEDSNFKSDLTKKDRKELLAALIPDLEYAIKSSPENHIKYSLVRSNEFLTRFEATATFDVNEVFYQATGLTLRDYRNLIFSISYVSLNLSPEEILRGTVLFVNTKPSPALEPLYDKLLQHTCISIEELAPKAKAEQTYSLHNEFRLWRKYPLVKIDENQIMCIDIAFLLEKLETGVFWLVLNELKKKKVSKGKEVIGLQGEVFEEYAASIIERGINAQTPFSMERCLIHPKYVQKQQMECTDVAVCGKDTLILLECKAPLLSAKTKFSNNFDEFYKGI